jgi:hypothetical protein
METWAEWEKRNKSIYYDGLLKSMKRRYGPKLGTFLTNRFAKRIKRTGDCLITDVRVARRRNLFEVLDFCCSRGCCASLEWEETFYDNGKKVVYLLGFNYGH